MATTATSAAIANGRSDGPPSVRARCAGGGARIRRGLGRTALAAASEGRADGGGRRQQQQQAGGDQRQQAQRVKRARRAAVPQRLPGGRLVEAAPVAGQLVVRHVQRQEPEAVDRAQQEREASSRWSSCAPPTVSAMNARVLPKPVWASWIASGT